MDTDGDGRLDRKEFAAVLLLTFSSAETHVIASFLAPFLTEDDLIK